MTVKYNSCATFGRFNIPHYGHVSLIMKMLFHGKHAHVYVSTGTQNNSWDLRVLLLRVLCRKQGVDLSQVTFKKAKNPYQAVKDSIEFSDFGETALVLGEDQFSMGIKLSTDMDVPLVLNKRQFSSTNVRFFMDNPEGDSNLQSIYSSNYAVRLAKMLRQEEVNRERPFKITSKAA